MDYFKVLEDLTMQAGLSGYESGIAQTIMRWLTPFVDEIDTDKAGNIISKINGSDLEAPTLMINAHMDSPGFIVRRIENDGYLQFDRLGGIPEKVLPALNVQVGTIDGQYVPGVITTESYDYLTSEDKKKVDGFRNLRIDIGAKSREDALAAGVHVGCPIVYKPQFTRMLGDRVAATAIDDRAGCTALIGIAERLHANRPRATVYVTASVMEEFNVRGAILIARKIKPDACIYLDIGLDGTTPEMNNSFSNVKIDGGAVVSLYNFHGRGTLNGCIAHKGLYELALRCSKEKDLDLQESAALGSLCDTAYIQFENDYIACLDMGMPKRYTHSPVEMVALGDVEKLSEFVSEMVNMMDKTFDAARY